METMGLVYIKDQGLGSRAWDPAIKSWECSN